MDSKKKLTLAWTVAGILAVLLVIALFFLANQPKDLTSVLEEGREDLTEQRDRIAESCNGTDAASKEECQDRLEELSDILREFSRDIDKATSSAAQ
jgi:hypothetical protein